MILDFRAAKGKYDLTGDTGSDSADGHVRWSVWLASVLTEKQKVKRLVAPDKIKIPCRPSIRPHLI